MGFLSICTALYDYSPQTNEELELRAGDILYILEKSSEDDWWKAKKRALTEDEEEEEGLIPSYYVEDARPIHSAKALYDYTRQTEEEVSFTDESVLHVYDVSDPDWTLVSVDGDYGFAPANYIEITAEAPAAHSAAASTPAVPAVPVSSYTAPRQPEPEPEPEQQPSPPASPVRHQDSIQARLANVMGGIAPASPPNTRNIPSPPMPVRQPTPELSDEEEPPPKPARPQSQQIAAAPPPAPIATPAYGEDDSPPHVQASPSFNRAVAPSSAQGMRSPGGFHLYNVSEMVSALGKRKKLPITLGLNVATGTIMLSPEKSRDGPTQEWTAEKLEHYSIEGKHVFLELRLPSKSLDLHAGAKDTAQEIVASLGEIAGAHKAEGLKDIISASAGGGQKKGVVLYDFMAQGDDEVTVAEGDEVIVLDDTKSEEWWNVRRIKNGKEGVVPSSYVEITGLVAVEPPTRAGINAGRSTVEQNRLEEERLAKEAARAERMRKDAEEVRAERELPLPERASSLAEDERRSSKRDKRSNKTDSKPRSKPDISKVRTWTDHSGSFKVDAQFLGVADGKIHLHKVNGVKIAVPVTKMSQPDLDYVEKVTNESIDEHIPVADLIKMKRRTQDSARVGASFSPQPDKTSDYDWFDFFLSAGVGPHQCERYAQAMIRDSMDESILPDIKSETLRALGLKEGDALKVMKHLDARYGRNRTNGASGEGGLFTGPGGALKDNTGRKRPEANRTNSDAVDAAAFQPESARSPSDAQAASASAATPVSNGFDDDAWTPKPSQRAATASPAAVAPTSPAAKPLSENMRAMNLLDDHKPLEPTPAPPAAQVPVPSISQSPPPVAQQHPAPQLGSTQQALQQVAALQPQQSGLSPLPTINAPGRQRPAAPQNYAGSSLLPPPPRPTSAPQHPQQSQFGLQPLQPQLTGLPANAHPAPPGQSLDELTAQRMQQYLQPQPTGFMQPMGMQMQPTGFQQQYGMMNQPFLNGNAAGSPFSDARAGIQPQPTGFGVNSMLPPALTPQRTGFPNAPPPMPQNNFNQFQTQQNSFQAQGLQSQPTGFQPQFSLQSQPTGFPQSNGFSLGNLPPVPPIPQNNTPAPLLPQKTGPAPDIKFGVNPAAKRLAPQPTGRRANLAQATADNPFGF